MPELPWPFRDARLRRLLVRSQRGDREAFRDLYRALYGPVSRFIRRRTPRVADAEDLVSQVFFRLLESLPHVDPRRGSVLAYTLSMARHALIDDARRRRGAVPEQAAVALPDAGAGPLERLLSDEETASVRAALAALPEETQELLALRYGDGLRYAEIAQMLGLTEAAVRQRTSRAVRELRTRWTLRSREGALANEG